MNYKSMFLAFLQRENALKSFLYNRKNHSLMDSSVAYLLDSSEPKLYIFKSFAWNHTKEGVSYWSDLNKEWEAFLERTDKHFI